MTPAELLKLRFVLRDDVYPVQSRTGGYRPVHEELTGEVLEKHLSGKLCAGVYQLRGDLVKWICIDVDGTYETAENAEDALRALVATARHFDLRPYVERSGKKGWHLWLFCEECSATTARAIGCGIVAEAGEAGQVGTSEVAVFPKQTSVGPGEFGNLVKLPWGKRRDNGARGVFVDADTLQPLSQADQLALLEAVTPHSAAELESLVAENGWTCDLFSLPPVVDEDEPDAAPLKPGGYEGELPCYRHLKDPEMTGRIPAGKRNLVLHRLAKQNARRLSAGVPVKESISLAEIAMIAHYKCDRPEEVSVQELRALNASAYKSRKKGVGCEVLQPLGLCPALAGEKCWIYSAQHQEEAEAEERAAPTNADWDLSIEPLRVLETSPPLYTACVAGQDLELNLDELISFAKFKRKCVAALRFLPKLPRRKDNEGNVIPAQVMWEAYIREALKGVIVEPKPPEDASPRGAMWEAICGFIRGNVLAETREKIRLGQIVVLGDSYYFRGEDLRRHLSLIRADYLPMNETWRLVRDKGGTAVLFRYGNQPAEILRAWKVPVVAVETEAAHGEEVEGDVTDVTRMLQE